MYRVLRFYIRLVPIVTSGSYVDCIFSQPQRPRCQCPRTSEDIDPTIQQGLRPRRYGQPRLPIELCEYIIDFLWDDIDALEACALTHPVLGVRCDYRVDEISRDTCLEDEVGLARLSKDLLASAAYSRYFGTIKIRVPGHSSWCYTVPLRLASRLTQLKQLELIGVFDSQKTHPSLSKHFGLFRSVTVIRLAECTFAAFADFARFIMSFPNLSTLDIVDVDWNQYVVLPHILGKSRTKKFHPKEIYIDLSIGRQGYLAQLFDWLVTTPATKSAVTLYIEIRFAEDFASLAKYIKAAEEALIQLRVHTHPGMMEAAHLSGEPVVVITNTHVVDTMLQITWASDRLLHSKGFSSMVWVLRMSPPCFLFCRTRLDNSNESH